MATTYAEPDNRRTVDIDTRTRVGGAWLAIGSLLLVGGSLLLFVGGVLQALRSGRPGDTLGLAIIAGDPTLWTAIHGINVIALAGFAIAGLVVLTTQSRLTRSWWTVSAWALLTVSALSAMTAPLSIATVMTGAATAGDAATFETWLGFVSAHYLALAVLGLAVAVIAASEARGGHGLTPTWAAWLGVVAGVGTFLGITLAFGLEVRPSGWLLAAVVMGLWTLWFGVSLARSDDTTRPRAAESAPDEDAAIP